MLSKQDNEDLCRVGPDAPMGKMMRQYWLPALKSEELATPDCAPMRLRLLGENLVAFRASSGKAGVIVNACPHRGASLFFGRNEEDGLRCVYHGWKFDITGACVDMPSEPTESNFKAKVRARAYPAEERNGVIWVYMGPRAVPPPLPHIEANMVSPDHYAVTRTTIMRECNYMQALEGDIDTSHSEFLHFGAIRQEETVGGSGFFYRRSTEPLKFVVADTEYGTTYAAYRPAGEDSIYWRMANFLFPFFTQTPSNVLGHSVFARAWVPLDDSHTMFWNIFATRTDEKVAPLGRGDTGLPRRLGYRALEYLPNTTDWLGRWKLVPNQTNDYLIDREEQRDISYSGLPGVFIEDQAVTESMGDIYDRSDEHLGTTDSMIIRTRRRLVQAARAFSDEGIVPPGVDRPEIFGQRSGWIVLPNGVDWLEGSAERRKAFIERRLEDLVPAQELVAASS